MASQMRVYVLLGAVLVATVWLEKTTSAQGMDAYTYCSMGYWNGNVIAECTGYDNSWGCFHDDYSIGGSLYSPTRSAPVGGLGWSYGGGWLPWQHETGSWSLSVGFRVHCSCLFDYYDFPFDIQEPIDPTVTLNPSGTHVVAQDSGDVIITATVNPPQFGQDLNWNATGGTQGDTNLQWKVSTTSPGEVTVIAWVGDAQDTTIVQVQPIPTGETHFFFNWLGGGGVSQWWQSLQPSDVSFAGRTVKEFVGGAGDDQCHFPGSALPPFTEITSGEWPVEPTDNVWGPDHLSWDAEDITYYRAQGRAPCSSIIP